MTPVSQRDTGSRSSRSRRPDPAGRRDPLVGACVMPPPPGHRVAQPGAVRVSPAGQACQTAPAETSSSVSAKPRAVSTSRVCAPRRDLAPPAARRNGAGGGVAEPGRGGGLQHAVHRRVAAARGQVRVGRGLGHGPDRGDAGVRSAEDLGPLLLGALRERGRRTGAAAPASRSGRAGRAGRPAAGSGANSQLQERRVELRLERADRHVPAVGRLVDVVERRPGVEQVDAALVGPGSVGEHPVGHRLQHRGPVDDGGVHHLARGRWRGPAGSPPPGRARGTSTRRRSHPGS